MEETPIDMVAYIPYLMADVVESSKRNLFTVASTFAGGGGSSIGYKLAGGRVLVVNEFVDIAADTYSINFPETPVIRDDIKTLTPEDFLRAAGLKPGELDVLDGSPPCSAFSTAGKRQKNWNKTKAYSEKKKVMNVEDLFLEYIRIAAGMRPKVVIAENVAGLTRGLAHAKLGQFINAFDGLGYIGTHKVLDAADYDTAQFRERVFFVYVRPDVAAAAGINQLNARSELFPEPTTPHPWRVTVGDALAGIAVDPVERQAMLDYVQRLDFQKKWLGLLPRDPDRRVSPADPAYRAINPKLSYYTMNRTSMRTPCSTLTNVGSRLSGSGVFHPLEDRKLATAEMMRIMGLPDDYKVLGKFDQRAERIGRMVAPKMMRALASHLYQKVLKPSQPKGR